ncbi:23S rRNA (uridine(2552)-2'-O)-methyltransferase RlmE [Ectothiorhodospiraceae bacterium 2226]|nr:23S rRNA (uridine(2552)-2'-O)-methyltransferase RlmE [Ectothiorhodospiraceae bacterium 2226]
MGRSKSSHRWLREHFDDPYVKRAQQEGWRARAVYKLQELDERYGLLRPGMTVVDLGAAPGGWAQYAARRVAPQGRVIALDLLPIEPIAGVTVVQGDFREEEPYRALLDALEGRPVDLVLSDMAPNISGTKAVDQPRAIALAELALELAREVLRPGGDWVAKTFQGEGFDALVRELRQGFERVDVRKPAASRPRSPEVYLVARNSRL